MNYIQSENIRGCWNKYTSQCNISHIDLSNESAWGVMNYIKVSKEKTLPRMRSIQNPYSWVTRSYEIGLSEVSIRAKIGCLYYSPLAREYLKGKYRHTKFPKGTVRERDCVFWKRYKKVNKEKAV